MTEYKRNFKGVWFPKEIWYCRDISWVEKLMLIEINSLDNENGCFASNKYFADFFFMSEIAVSNHIKKLKDKGYIKEVHFDGRKRILKSCLKVIFKADLNQPLNQNNKNLKSSIKETFKYNNKDNNTINNKDNNKKKRKNFKKPTIKEIESYCNQRRNNIDPEGFFYFYESKGWMVGSNKMKDWKAAVRTWEIKNKKVKNKTYKSTPSPQEEFFDTEQSL